ncbi:hypothetical protein AL346_00165 [Chelatococcus sp. CO-6]|nr:hypothetical protein AL346_00165 [Chelatococcus sp. CO-6]
MRRGDKHTPTAIERMKRAQRARWRREKLEQRRAAKERRRQRGKARTTRPVVTLEMKIAARLEPGRRYSQPEVIEATGLKRGSVVMRLKTMRERGLLERERNPAWRPHVYVKGLPISVQAKRAPEWLYRLTPAGEELHEAARLVI